MVLGKNLIHRHREYHELQRTADGILCASPQKQVRKIAFKSSIQNHAHYNKENHTSKLLIQFQQNTIPRNNLLHGHTLKPADAHANEPGSQTGMVKLLRFSLGSTDNLQKLHGGKRQGTGNNFIELDEQSKTIIGATILGDFKHKPDDNEVGGLLKSLTLCNEFTK